MKQHLVGCGVQLVSLVCFLDDRVMIRLKFVKIIRYTLFIPKLRALLRYSSQNMKSNFTP